MFKHKSLLICAILSVIVVSGCPDRTNPVPTPTPSPTIFVSTPPIPVVSTDPILGDYYKIEFGPGSKGVSTFGPGSKGINDFGPGSKGISEFGPGSKGVSNLRFNVNIPETLVRKDLSFNAKEVIPVASAPLQLGNLILRIEKDNKVFVKTTLLPVDQQIIFTLFTDLPPGNYNLFVMAENNFEPLQVADLVKLESNLEVKVVLYAKELNRENLDIAIRTKPIQEISEQ